MNIALLITLFLSVIPYNQVLSKSKKSKKRYTIINIKIEKKDSLAKAISRFVKDDSIIRKKSPMVQKTFKSNPHIKNWKKIPPGSRIKLYISSNFIDKDKLKKYKNLKRSQFKKRKKRRKKRKLTRNWNISTQGGTVSISADSGESLDMNFFKLALKYSNKWNKSLSYVIALSTVKFTNLDASRSTETTSIESPLPEAMIGVSKKMSKNFSTSLAFDTLNYFVVEEESADFLSIASHNVQRISLRPYYILSPSFGTLASVGYLFGKASGFDASLGLNYVFGKNKNYSLALISYMSFLKVSSASENSKASVISIGASF